MGLKFQPPDPLLLRYVDDVGQEDILGPKQVLPLTEPVALREQLLSGPR
jgi:hypothetical protein